MIERLNPFVRLASEVSSKNFRKYRMVGLDCRIFYVNSGSCVLNVEGIPHTMSAGTVAYIPAACDYEFRFTGAEEMILTVLNFDFDCSRSGAKEIMKPVDYETFLGEKLDTGYVPEEFRTHVFINDATSIGKDVHKIRMLFFNKDSYYRDFASATLKTVLLNMISHTHSDGAAENALGIISYVKKHYAERLVAKELSAIFGYHPNHINRLVKLNTGMGFKEFVIYYRLKVARDLLLSTSDSVTSISASCGFSGASYFSEQFLKHVGMTPREYRASLGTSAV